MLHYKRFQKHEEGRWIVLLHGAVTELSWESRIIVPDAGHVCNVDNRSFFNRVSLNFLRKF